MEIEIDPKLFITCRLCMECGENGMYQIIPAVQDQIRYCFDIDISPFDGLPQLICKTCKKILLSYFEKKKLFKSNQECLKTSITAKKDDELQEDATCQPEQELTSSSTEEVVAKQPNKHDSPEDSHQIVAKKRSLNFFSTSSSEVATNIPTIPIVKKRKTTKKKITCPENYNLFYSCRFCFVEVINNKGALFSHVRHKHKALLQDYKNVIVNQCIVSLNKIDSQVNETGMSDTVMVTENKIFKHSNHPFYNIKFKAKKKQKTDNSFDDSSDNEFIGNKFAKRIRLLSRSSNDTVVLGNTNKSPNISETELVNNVEAVEKDNNISISECINIDDSSNDSLATDNQDQSQKKQANSEEYLIIQNLISLWYKKHCKRMIDNKQDGTSQRTESDMQLKHKILSIGRKVINKQCFSCNGILRYLENKNLKINWIQAPSKNENNFVRINIKEKGNETNKTNVWHDLEINNFDEYSQLLLTEINSTENNSAVSSSEITCSVLQDHHLRNVLLNANPVANPKQLPKKTLMLDNDKTTSKTSNMKKSSLSISNKKGKGNSSSNAKSTDETISNDNMCMPIITSTTSLAPIQKEIECNNQNNNDKKKMDQDGVNIAPPRIKVKSVSELMGGGSVVEKPYPNLLSELLEGDPRRMTANVEFMNSSSMGYKDPNQPFLGTSSFVSSQSENNVATSNFLAVQQSISPSSNHTQYIIGERPHMRLIPRCIITTQQAEPLQPLYLQPLTPVTYIQTLPNEPESSNNSSASKSIDYVVLDTIEMPNTKTDSPHKYFKNLLKIHGLELHDSSESLAQDFICLVKFKLVFHQKLNSDGTEQHVVLALSLLCSNSDFCLKIRDKNSQTINIHKLNANWQWEILKTCTGDVVNKLLQNAQRHGQSVYENTKKLICLLKSIKVGVHYV